MKAIKNYLLPFVLILGSFVLKAQDDFYKEKTNTDTVETILTSNQELNENQYYTESDYNEVNQNSNLAIEFYSEEEEFYSEDEIYSDSSEEVHEKRRNGAGAEIAAEIFVEVVYHALFFVAWWLQ